MEFIFIVNIIILGSWYYWIFGLILLKTLNWIKTVIKINLRGIFLDTFNWLKITFTEYLFICINLWRHPTEKLIVASLLQLLTYFSLYCFLWSWIPANNFILKSYWIYNVRFSSISNLIFSRNRHSFLQKIIAGRETYQVSSSVLVTGSK